MLAIALPLVILLVLLMLPYYILFLSRRARMTARLPGPSPLPVIGNAHEFGRDPVAFMANMSRFWRQYGNVFKVWLGPKLFVMTAEPHHLEALMSSNINIAKSATYKHIQPWLGTGLLTASGTKWKEHRKMITPAFHFKILEQFVDIFPQNTDILIRKLQPHLYGPPFNIYEYITLVTLDIICETALGVPVHAQENSESEYVSAVKGMANIVMKRSFTPWMHFDMLFNLSKLGKKQQKYLQVLHNTTREVIQARKQQYLKNKKNDISSDSDIGQKKRLALLDMLLDTSRTEGNFTDEEIREEVDTFMFAGHDTTASAISFCLFLLGLHLDVQEKVYDELKEIFGNSGHKTTFQDLQNMKYLECVIKEALRLYSSVPLYGRSLIQDLKIGDITLPAGTNVVCMAYFLHHDPKIYINPEKFNPDRFQQYNIQGRHPYSYVPFSAGPRNCIGQKFAMLEMKSIISEVLRKYKLIASEDFNMDLSLEIVLRSEQGIFLRIEER